MPSEESRPAERQRVDRWLVCARVVKTRSLAAKLVTGGKVRINREKTGQASHPVRTGDVLTITLMRQVLVYRVLRLAERRGPASEARLLYEDLTPPEIRGDRLEPAPGTWNASSKTDPA